MSGSDDESDEQKGEEHIDLFDLLIIAMVSISSMAHKTADMLFWNIKSVDRVGNVLNIKIKELGFS